MATQHSDKSLVEIRDLLQGGAAITLQSPITSAPLVKVTDSFTRPNTTTQYTASDEVSNNAAQASAVPLHFANVVSANGATGYVVHAALEISSKNVTNASFRLYLFNAAPVMVGDNVAYSLLHAERAARVGFIDFTLTSEGGSSDCAEGEDTIKRAFKCGAASKDLWGVLVAKAGYTPAAGLEVVTVSLVADNALI